MTPTLFNEGEQKTHEYLYIEFTKGGAQKLHSQALRFGKWKAYKAAKGKLELFDLNADPFEKKNLAAQEKHQKTLEKAKAYLKKASTPIK